MLFNSKSYNCQAIIQECHLGAHPQVYKYQFPQEKGPSGLAEILLYVIQVCGHEVHVADPSANRAHSSSICWKDP